MSTKTSEIFDDLKQNILKGVYANQRKLPTEQELTSYYAASRNTIRNVLKNLEVEGLLYSVQGSGYYTHDARIIDSIALKSLNELTNTQTSYSKVLKFETIIATHELAAIFDIQLGSRIHYFERLRYQNNVLMMYEKCYLPFFLFPTFSSKDAAESVYHYVEKVRNFSIAYAIRDYQSVLLTDEEKKLLELPKQEPQAAFKTTSTSFLDIGRAFVYSEILEHNTTHTAIARRH